MGVQLVPDTVRQQVTPGVIRSVITSPAASQVQAARPPVRQD